MTARTLNAHGVALGREAFERQHDNLMKAHKVTLLIIDLDQVGAEDIKIILENQKFPNRCIAPDVKDIETVDIGEWDDDHPLNQRATADAEYQRLFPA